MTQSEIVSAIRLLDDPDKQIYDIVKEKLSAVGTDLIAPAYEALSSETITPLMRSRLENLVSGVESSSLIEAFKTFDADRDGLLEGYALVTKFKYFFDTKKELETIFNDFNISYSLEDLENFSETEQAKIINNFIYYCKSWRVTLVDTYFDPDLCFLKDIMKVQRANPVALGLVYILIARKFNLNIFGVNLPKIFVLAFCKKGTKDILFYINPSNLGAIFGQREVESFLSRNNIPSKKEYFMPCSDQTVLLRLLTHLEYSYKTKKMFTKANSVSMLIKTFSNQLDKDTNWI